MCYHVINRGNRRQTVFHDDSDYSYFLDLIRRANARLPASLLAFCLMPNHIHLAIRPEADGDLGRWMQWLLTAHVRRHHGRYRTDGRIWQGRYKAFAIQADEHLLTVLRYVERNALRAGLVESAEHWRYGSLYWRISGNPGNLLAECAASSIEDWINYVNAPQSASELLDLRASLNKETPFGAREWRTQIAGLLGLGSSLRGPGRPARDADPSAPAGRAGVAE
jgi:putative transposase